MRPGDTLIVLATHEIVKFLWVAEDGWLWCDRKDQLECYDPHEVELYGESTHGYN